MYTDNDLKYGGKVNKQTLGKIHVQAHNHQTHKRHNSFKLFLEVLR